LTALAHELDEVEDFSLEFWRQLGSASGDIGNEVGCVHVISDLWQAKVGAYHYLVDLGKSRSILFQILLAIWVKFTQKRSGFHQILGVKAFGEPVVDRLQ
jgi:hypothetical protein